MKSRKFKKNLENNKQLAALINNQDDFIIKITSDGRIQFINRTPAVISIKETIGQKILDSASRKQNKKIRKAIQHVLKTGKTTSYEDIDADNSVVLYKLMISPVKHGGKTIALEFIAKNMNEEKEIEVKLKETEEKYKTLVENAQDTIFMIDKNLKIISMNSKAASLFGKTPAEVVGVSIYKIFPKESAVRFAKNNEEVFRTGKSKFIEEKMTIGNKVFYNSTSLSPVKDSDGDTTAVIGIVRDITEKKKAEDELRESEEKYRVLVESIPDISWTTDESGKTPFISQNIKEIYGYSPEEIYKKGDSIWLGRIHPQDIKKVKEAYELLFKKNKRFDIEYRIKRKDGKWIWLHDRATNVYKENNISYATGLFTDITEKKKAEDALKQSEEKFRNFFENSNDASFIADGKTRKIVDCNKKAEILMEYSKTKILTMNADNLHPKDKIKETMEGFKKQMTGKITLLETEVLTKSGKRTPVSINASSVEFNGKNYAIAIFRDITEQKKAEDAVKESENKFSKIFKSSPDMIALTRISDGFFVDANNSVKDLLGYGREELLGHTIKELGLWPNPEERELMVQTIKKQGSIKGMEVHLRKKSGEIIFSKISVEIMELNGKKFLLSVAHDITEEKRAREIIKKEIERMKEIDEAKTNFLNIVSHEMKTPLTAINAHLGVLDDLKTNLSEQELLSLSAIKRNNYLLKSLIDNILELSRIESGKFELNMSKINLERVIKEVKSNLEILSEKKGLQLIIDVGKLPEILADEMRVREILNNLISNSIKFTDKGWIKVKAEKQDNHVVISIIDTGIGISKDKINNLFQKFYQIDPSIGRRFGGTGLGLVITKQLIELQGGKINVHSIYGKGSTFSVILPINNHILKGGAK
jgi:PAS domain S-box-containing protein